VPERLQKMLAGAGVGSRRACEELIARGQVMVNGRVATLGQIVDGESDDVRVRGAPVLSNVALSYLAFHKPVGYTTSTRSTHGEHTMYELLDLPGRLFPVGRLDMETSGLLLLTNDGEWANIVTHPRYEVEKEYRALVRGVPSSTALHRLRSGVTLPEGETTQPARVEIVSREGSDTWLTIILTEGKKRQIRLITQAVGHPAMSLERIRIGDVHLGDLPSGKWRTLLDEEIQGFRRHAA
jgi:23S rRNA pseudouridine2605 synthase